MFAEELVVLDARSSLWNAVRPLLDAALRLERQDINDSWNGWKKKDIEKFLHELPAHCALLGAVWETGETTDRDGQGPQEREELVFGCICEVLNGEIRSIRTFDALSPGELPPLEQLEPGYPHAIELMRATRAQVAPVAWALFTDRVTWNEWLFSEQGRDTEIDKGALLAAFARQGRCVLMGSQTAQHHV